MNADKSPEEHTSQEHISHSPSLAARLRGYFIAGILVVAPITITIFLSLAFLNIVDTQVAKVLPERWYDALYGKTTVPGMGLLIAVAFFIVIGWVTRNFLGRFFIRLSESIVDRMPVIRNIYGTVKQIFETVMASQSQAFREVVMLEYPRKGIWSIGFLTGTTKGEAQELTDSETVNVFLPTTPNPTSGFLLFVPKKELRFLDMTVEEGIKMVVSAGIITPVDKAKKKTASAASSSSAPAKKTAAKKKPAAKKKTSVKKRAVAKKKPAAKKTASAAARKKKPAAKRKTPAKKSTGASTKA